MKGKRKIIFAAVLMLAIAAPAIVNVKETPAIWAATENAAGTWIQVGEKWWYKHTDGSYTKSDWEKIRNRWYYFDASGWMVTGVAREGLQPGDVVIYEGDRDLGAIYLGDNRVIYAASPRWGVRITNLEHPGEPAAYRRVW